MLVTNKVALKKSRIFLGLLIALSLGASTSIALIDVSNWLKITLLSSVIGNFTYILRQHILLKNRQSVIALEKINTKPNEIWNLYCRDSIKIVGTLRCGYNSRYLLVFNFKISGRYALKSIIIFKDAMITPEDWRFLKQLIFLIH